MGVMDLLGDAVNSALGVPKKAMLIVFTGSDPVFDSQSVAAAAAGALGGSAAGILSSMKNILSGPMGNSQTQDYHVLEVQYNPSTINLQANAESVPVQYLQQNLDSGIPTQLQRPPSVVLSVELVFDDMNIADSFMAEKFTSGVSSQTISNLVSMGRSLAGKTWSVQAQTNALLALLLKDSTRTVTFKWADMTFTGEATEVQARYTMFSTSGRPVRSVVRMNITQQVRGTADLQYWNQALDKMLAESGDSLLDKVGNLINIGF